MPGDYNELDVFRGDLPSPDGGLNPAPQYVLSTLSYLDPPWITSLAWSKLTGIPTFLNFTLTIPVAHNSTGTAGSFASDGKYLYVCYAANLWGYTPLNINFPPA